MITLCSVAFAGLEVERAARSLAEGRPFEALDTARSAIVATPGDAEAWTVYLAACEASGLGSACRAEATVTNDTSALSVLRMERLAGREVTALEVGDPDLQKVAAGDLAGVDHPLALVEHLADVAHDDPDAAAELALKTLAAHPDRPDLLIGLFDPKLPPVKSIAKARKKLLKTGQKRVSSAAPEELYRWLTLWIATGTDATTTVDRLEEAGEARPLGRAPLSRAEQVRLSNQVLAGEDSVPANIPAEHEAVVLKALSTMRQSGKLEEGVEQLSRARAVRDSVSLAYAEAEAWLELKEPEKALTVADATLVMAAGAWPTDRAGLAIAVRRQAIGRAMALRGRVHLEAGDAVAATIDLMIANQLALEPVDAAALERAMKKARYGLETEKAKLETAAKSAQQNGMEQARAAIEAGDQDAARAHLHSTLAALVLPSHSKARLTSALIGRPFIARALALRATLQDEGHARADRWSALLLNPYNAPADLWQAHAESLEAEAAVFADAMAAALDEERERTLKWPGSAGDEAASAALVAQWMRDAPTVDPNAAKITRGIVVTPNTVKKVGRVEGKRPALNAPFPKFALATPHGEAQMRIGRITLVVFFRADSPNSRRAMRELSVMAQNLRRKSAIDAIVIGVSVDEEEKTLTDLAGERDGWGPSGWDPEMGKRFGVDGVPTVFVVDSQGVARFIHVGYLGTAEYEGELRLLGGI